MTEQHVPVERLAAYAAGDLDATAGLAVEAHVLLCADCRAEVEAVNRATAALASLEPVAMPQEVADRIDAALAGADTSTGPAGDIVPLQPRRKRPSFAGIAAVAAGFALVGAIAVPLVTNDGTDDPRVTAADSGAESVSTRRLESNLNYTNEDIPGVLAQALGGARDRRTAGNLYSWDGALTPAPAVGGPAPEDAVSATPNTRPRSEAAKALSLTILQSDAARLAACVAALGESQPGIGRTPLLVDFARYLGRPALIVVFPTVLKGAIAPARVDVWVVGPRCGITAGDDDVLTFARIAKPKGL